MYFAAIYAEDDELLTGEDTGLWSLTLTAGWARVDGVTVRMEYRHDDADEDVFNEDDDDAEDTLDTAQAQVSWTPKL